MVKELLKVFDAGWRVSSSFVKSSWFMSLVLIATWLSSAKASSISLLDSDLAIVMPRDHVGLGSETGLLRPLWYDQVKEAFLKTSVGDALERENAFSDWQVVAIRIVPCSPLGETPKQDIDVFCWPEVRLVWQPILLTNVPGREKNFADDRALHALYDINPAIYLESSRAQELNQQKDLIRRSLADLRKPAMSELELASFMSDRNLVTRAFLSDVLKLRTSLPLSTIDVRSEFTSRETSKEFVTRLRSLLAKIALPQNLKHLTAFSLPEGKDAPGIDEWVFLKFSGKQGKLSQDRIELRSAESGKVIFDFGLAPRAFMLRDDPLLYDWLSRFPNPEIEKNVMVFGDRRSHSHIADRRIISISSTSCGSCHKLKAEKFNFHALSYLGRDELDVSPRVKMDVKLDQEWLERYLKP